MEKFPLSLHRAAARFKDLPQSEKKCCTVCLSACLVAWRSLSFWQRPLHHSRKKAKYSMRLHDGLLLLLAEANREVNETVPCRVHVLLRVPWWNWIKGYELMRGSEFTNFALLKCLIYYYFHNSKFPLYFHWIKFDRSKLGWRKTSLIPHFSYFVKLWQKTVHPGNVTRGCSRGEFDCCCTSPHFLLFCGWFIW